MTRTGWKFPLLDTGNEQGYTNGGIETFKGDLIDNLAREICQNSLDAKDLSKTDIPVIVEFQLKTLKRKEFDVFEGYKRCLDGCKKYWTGKSDPKLEKFLKMAENAINKDEISLLVVSDYNTTGLIGSKLGRAKTSWNALTHSDGTSVKGKGSGGSFGIGKNAPFACSELSMVFYNTCAKDEEKAFQGVARLATLINETNDETQGVGHYWNKGTNSPIYENDICKFRDEFTRNDYGTDIIIVGFKPIQNLEAKIEKAIIRNFFLAIEENKLIVKIGEEILDKNTLSQKLKEVYKDDKSMLKTNQFYETLTTSDKPPFTISILEDGDAEFYLKTDKDYTSREVAKIRSGMLITTQQIQIFQEYMGILVIRGEKLGELLKDTEPVTHTAWQYTRIEDDNKRKEEARLAIKNLSLWVEEILNKQDEINTEEDINPEEVGEYLPDELDDLCNQENKKQIDKLNITQKLKKVENKKIKPGIIEFSEKDSIGTPEGQGKEQASGNSGGVPPFPSVKHFNNIRNILKDEKEGGKDGVIETASDKIIKTPNLKGQRAFPVHYQGGLYKVIACAGDNYSNVYMSFSAIGEDKNKEDLKIEYYTYNGRKVLMNNKNKMGPMALPANTIPEIKVKFDTNEKLELDLKITQEV